MIERSSRIAGCIWGGAVGDALGAPIEFMSLGAIRRKYGEQGVREYVEFEDGTGAITDDTQMLLFTAEGVLKGGSDILTSIHKSYLRWVYTQGVKPAISKTVLDAGWLVHESGLNRRRCPGNTCLSSLRQYSADLLGEAAQNDSKGCGSVMRVAPVAWAKADDVFGLGCAASWLTHGHPTGWLSGGALALLINRLLEGDELDTALDTVLAETRKRDNSEQVEEAILGARRAASQWSATAESVEQLGGGWIAEEALAIAIFCALKYPTDFREAVILAANISGDSDSTAAITGNIMGTLLGVEAIPQEWIDNLQERDIIAKMVADCEKK